MKIPLPHHIGRFRWEAVGGVCALLVAAGVMRFGVPFVKAQWNRAMEIRRDLTSVKPLADYQHEIVQLEQTGRELGELIARYEQQPEIDQTEILRHLYTLADSAQCSAMKVSIDNPVEAGGILEIPVTIEGGGTYQALGEFIDGIESMVYPIRIRALDITGPGDKLKFVVDFVVMQ